VGGVGVAALGRWGGSVCGGLHSEDHPADRGPGGVERPAMLRCGTEIRAKGA